jgi:hypothetical protein
MHRKVHNQNILKLVSPVHLEFTSKVKVVLMHRVGMPVVGLRNGDRWLWGIGGMLPAGEVSVKGRKVNFFSLVDHHEISFR